MTEKRMKALHAKVRSKYPDALAIYIDVEKVKRNKNDVEYIGMRIRLKNSKLNIAISPDDVAKLLKEVS
jgi:hypothetical protein